MDIFEWAKDFPGADYYDPNTGYIYKCKDYETGVTPDGIMVLDSMGRTIGIVRANKEEA